MIYLDNAATSGVKPSSVINAVGYALKNLSSNPGRGGHSGSVEAATKVFSVREKLCKFFNCESENSVCFTANCTASVNTVLYGCLNPGDHIIISSLEHNAVLRPLVYMAQNRGISYDVVGVNVREPEKCVTEFEKKIKYNTKMIFTTHASNVTGTVLPIKQIGELCRNKKLLFGVDAAQSVGHLKIDMKDMYVDYLCVAPHKGLYAPMGVGVLIADKPINNVLIKGGTGVNSLSYEQPDSLPERIESGTINVPGICGIGAGVDYSENLIKKKAFTAEKKLLHILYVELRKMGAELFTEEPLNERYVSVLSFNIQGHSSEEVAQYLARNNVAVRGGLHCAPLAHKTLGTIDRGTVRVSTSVFNNVNEIEKVVFLLKKFKNSY